MFILKTTIEKTIKASMVTVLLSASCIHAMANSSRVLIFRHIANTSGTYAPTTCYLRNTIMAPLVSPHKHLYTPTIRTLSQTTKHPESHEIPLFTKNLQTMADTETPDIIERDLAAQGLYECKKKLENLAKTPYLLTEKLTLRSRIHKMLRSHEIRTKLLTTYNLETTPRADKWTSMFKHAEIFFIKECHSINQELALLLKKENQIKQQPYIPTQKT